MGFGEEYYPFVPSTRPGGEGSLALRARITFAVGDVDMGIGQFRIDVKPFAVRQGSLNWPSWRRVKGDAKRFIADGARG